MTDDDAVAAVFVDSLVLVYSSNKSGTLELAAQCKVSLTMGGHQPAHDGRTLRPDTCEHLRCS